jgi:hypothetical protein
MNTFITAGVLFPLRLKVIPQVSIQDRSELLGVNAKWTAK